MTDSSKNTWFSRLKASLSKTRAKLSDGVTSLVLGKKNIDAELYEHLETILLTADMGVPTTQMLIQKITEQVARKSLSDPQVLTDILRNEMIEMLKPFCQPLSFDKNPFFALVVGINGAGKTTSIAKMAHYYQQQNKKVLLAAGDTFRAAAIDQLQEWGNRLKIPVISQPPGADSASVIFDAMDATIARKFDLLLADTAGRLHTQNDLMRELEKIKRVMQKKDVSAPHETLLVVDGNSGQNALQQAKEFHKKIQLTGLSVTKLDGTAKGGVIFSLVNECKLPLRFIGVGEGIDDLKPFIAEEFVNAIF